MAEVSSKQRLSVLLDTPAIKAKFEGMLGDRHSGFMSSILSVVNNNEALASCDPMSVIAAAAMAASMDLPINPSLGLSYIIPYGDVATFQIGWRGVYQLAMRSMQYETIHPCCIFEGQLVERNSFTGEIKFQEARTSDKIIGYLLYFKLHSGFKKFFYMSHDEMEAHGKKYSKQYQKGKGFWVTDFPGQGMKTVIKLGLSKFGILSIELQKAFELDGGASTGNNHIKPDEVEEPAKKNSDRMDEVVAKASPPASTAAASVIATPPASDAPKPLAEGEVPL